MTKMFMSGWIAALAVAGAWLTAEALRGPQDEGEQPAPAKRTQKPAVAKAKRPAHATPEPWQSGKKVKSRNPSFRPLEFTNAEDLEFLGSLLGDAPPETRALVNRILKARRKKKLKDMVAYAKSAAACQDPLVKTIALKSLAEVLEELPLPADISPKALDKMAEKAASAIRNHLAGEAGEKVAADISEQLKTGISKMQEEVPNTLLSLLDASMPFLSDSNRYVQYTVCKNIIKAASSLCDMGCGDVAVPAVAELLKAQGQDSAFWSSDGEDVDSLGTGCELLINCLHVKNDEAKGRLMSLVATTIDGLEGESRRLAEYSYKLVTDQDFDSPQATAEWLAWKKEGKEEGAKYFGSEEKGEEFIESLDRELGKDGDKLAGLEPEVDAARQMFKSPSVVVEYVAEKEELRKSALERYGDTKEGENWFQEEVSVLEKRMRELDMERQKKEN